MRTCVDRRVIDFEADPEALGLLAHRREAWLEGELGLARLLARIDGKAAFLAVGASSIEDLATRRGYDGARAGRLCALGHALAAEPGIEPALREGTLSFAAALAIAPIYRDAGALLAAGDDWVGAARALRLRDVTRLVRRRIESVRQGVPVTRTWSAQVGRETAEDLERCQDVASRRAGHGLTRGQLLTVLARSFRLDFDPTVLAPRPRRVPHTSERPHDRYVPAEVVRTILTRSGGRCEFGDCPRTAMHLCHLKPHRDGSPREARDLVDGCPAHHRALDAGLIRFLGWSADGGPVFLVVDTNEMLAPRRASTSDGWAGRPEDAWPAWMVRVLGAKAARRRRQFEGQAGASSTLSSPPAGPSPGASAPGAWAPGALAPGGLAPGGSAPGGSAPLSFRDGREPPPDGSMVRDRRHPAPGRRPGRAVPYRTRSEDPGYALLR